MLKKALYQKNKLNFVLSIILTISMALLAIYVAFLLQLIINTIINGTVGDLDKLILGSLLFLIGYALITLLRNFFKFRYLKRGLMQYKETVCKKTLEKDMFFFKQENTGEYLSIFVNNATFISDHYLNATLLIVYNIVVLVASVALMFYYHFLIASIVVLTAFFPLLTSIIFGKSLSLLGTELAEKNGRFTAFSKEILSAFPIIKGFKKEKTFLKLFLNENTQLETIKEKTNLKTGYAGVLSMTLSYITLFSVYILSGYFVMSGELTFGSVMIFVQLSSYILEPISELGTLLPNRKAAKSIMEKDEKLLSTVHSPEKTQRLKDFTGRINLQNLTFSYDMVNDSIKNINYTFEQNKSYGIVGGSGSGKSTLLKLLAGYLSNYQGKLTLDHLEMKEICNDSIFHNISFIEQEIFIFDSSIKNNITLFSDVPESQLHNAIQQSGLEKLVEEKGLDYICGENGNQLSGGERQRISIARALLKEGKVLLIDEGTSAIDQKTSIEIEQEILNIENTTKITVTHKLIEQVLRKYDEILVMQNGEVVETGTFEQLMNNKNQFFHLYQSTEAEMAPH